MRFFWNSLGIVAFVTMVSTSSAYATLVTYTDRTAWAAAVSGGTATIDFNGLAQGSAWWLSSSTTIGTTSFSSDGGDLWAVNRVAGFDNYYGSDYLLWNPSLDDNDQLVGLTLTTTFGRPVTAAGWDFGALDGSRSRFVFGIGGTSFTLTSDLDAYRFFGIISDTQFSEITMNSPEVSLDNQGPMGTLDNLSYAPVPEPSTILLLSLGLVGAGILKRRRAA